MKVSDLTPAEREEIIRDMKEHYPNFELRDDAEINHYLFPFPKDDEPMAIDKAQAIWEAQAQQAASEWQAEPGVELADFLRIVNRAFDRILSIPKIPSWRLRAHSLMMRRRSLFRIDDSKSGRRRVALHQRRSISARAGGPSIDLIDISTKLTRSPTLCGSSIAMMQPADLRDCIDLALLRRFDLSWKW
jgi:hypothetical protein